MAPIRGCALLLISGMAIIGGVVGVNLNLGRHLVHGGKVYPLPHHMPKHPGAVTLRFAMVHDVLHERYPVHGKAYYEERNRRAQQAIAQAPTEPNWDLVDDLAVGLDRLGKHAEAVALMRRKLEQQEQQGVSGRDLYASYANLGTFLILWQLDEGFADKEQAKTRVRESIDLIHHAIAIKPDAHFGREIWQAVLEEWLLAFLDDPQLLLKFDMVGNQLDAPVDPRGLRPLQYNRYEDWHYAAKINFEGQDYPSNVARVRKHITRLGADEGWSEAGKTSHTEPVPFDEPALGIIGMWRYGGGANPHFSLALAETMLRVGQRYIAWCGYERTVQLAGGIPEPVRAQFVQHCRERQQVIEAQLPEEEIAKLRPRFEAELKYGKDYQAAYQQYEAERIATGGDINDPHFYDAFHATHGDIASPVGQEDQFVVEDKNAIADMDNAMMVLGAGLFAFGTACFLAWANTGRRRAAAGGPLPCP